MHQRFQLAHLAQWIGLHAINRAPRHLAFTVGGERTHPRADAVGDHHQHVVGGQVGDIFPICLHLVVEDAIKVRVVRFDRVQRGIDTATNSGLLGVRAKVFSQRACSGTQNTLAAV